jgi:hypothetical protein
MSDLLQRLKLGSDNVKLIDWPGTDKKVALKILSQQDTQLAAFDTERIFKSNKIEISMVTAEEYESEKSTQILYRALRDPEKLSEAIAGTITEFRSLLSREEKKLLIDQYLAFESECSPSPDNLSNEEFDRLVESVKKKVEQTLGSVSNIGTLKRLITTLVSQLSSLPQVSG